MERSKGYALMFLLGAFIAGGALALRQIAWSTPNVDAVCTGRARTDREWQRSSSLRRSSRRLLIR